MAHKGRVVLFSDKGINWNLLLAPMQPTGWHLAADEYQLYDLNATPGTRLLHPHYRVMAKNSAAVDEVALVREFIQSLPSVNFDCSFDIFADNREACHYQSV